MNYKARYFSTAMELAAFLSVNSIAKENIIAAGQESVGVQFYLVYLIP